MYFLRSSLPSINIAENFYTHKSWYQKRKLLFFLKNEDFKASSSCKLAHHFSFFFYTQIKTELPVFIKRGDLFFFFKFSQTNHYYYCDSPSPITTIRTEKLLLRNNHIVVKKITFQWLDQTFHLPLSIIQCLERQRSGHSSIRHRWRL